MVHGRDEGMSMMSSTDCGTLISLITTQHCTNSYNTKHTGSYRTESGSVSGDQKAVVAEQRHQTDGKHYSREEQKHYMKVRHWHITVTHTLKCMEIWNTKRHYV